MSIDWKYISNSDDNINKIDVIYCSHIDMTIPIVYYWSVLMKDGTEYDLVDPILNSLLKSDIDIEAYSNAYSNYMNL